MMYDEDMIAPMRQELAELGITETRTPEEVDRYLKDSRAPPW